MFERSPGEISNRVPVEILKNILERISGRLSEESLRYSWRAPGGISDFLNVFYNVYIENFNLSLFTQGISGDFPEQIYGETHEETVGGIPRIVYFWEPLNILFL